VTDDRSELRRRLRFARGALSTEELAVASARLAAQLCDLLTPRRPGRVATYFAAGGELDPNVAAAALRGDGWVLHLPVLQGSRSMAFVEWDEGAGLVPNRYGIPEPPVDAGQVARAAIEMDVVLLPCVALDLRGNRMGMGAGFYDRALEGLRGPSAPLLVGIVHDDAVVDALGPAPWDVPVDVVLTDRRMLRPRGG
jgi:5-formyltetrahydrofolate cyclo-ligase